MLALPSILPIPFGLKRIKTMKLAISFITGCIAVITILVLWHNSVSQDGFIWSLISVGCLIMFSVLMFAEWDDPDPYEDNNTPWV